MKLAGITVVVTMLTAPSFADPDPARCTRGLGYAKAGDLPRAALYLDGCSGTDAERAAGQVMAKLRASELSALTISSDPAGVAVETDAMPGEALTTPVTIWVKAGTYELHGPGQHLRTTLAARSRGMVILTVPKLPAGPRTGVVNMADEPTDPPVSGPPPAQKHPSLLPCRYDGCDTHSGEVLVDPLARRAERVELDPPALRVGVRAGLASSERISPAFAVAAQWHLIAVRADGSERERDGASYTGLGLAVGLAHPVWSPDAGWVSLGVALRGELRPNAPAGPMTISHGALGATADLELALRRLPVTLGARYDQGFAGEHAVVVELGFDERWFR
ncbi:MAG: hypothetical protein ABI467_25720 [Kofleriaceae bacterium]